MKTPMQRFKEILLRQRDYNLNILQEYSSNSESCDARVFFEAYQARLFLAEDMLHIIDIDLMQEEKDCIIAADEFGSFSKIDILQFMKAVEKIRKRVSK